MASLPANPIGLYWPYWSSETARLTTFPTTYNVFFLFHATPDGGSPGTTGAVTLLKPTNITSTQYNQDIETCRSRGQRVIMTIGGAGAQVGITTKARADAFVQSVKDDIETLKTSTSLAGSAATVPSIDGIDFNSYEGSPASGLWLTYAALTLKDFYGSDFLITSPPAIHGQSPGGQADLDREVLCQMHAGDHEGEYSGTYSGTALNWFCPQCYDGPGNDTTAAVRSALNWYNTAETINGVSVQIPRTKIGVGFGISTLANYWTTAEASSAYSTMISEGKTPKGAFNWSALLDPSSTFASGVGPVITNNEEVATLSIKSFNGKVRAAIKKINGILLAAIREWK